MMYLKIVSGTDNKTRTFEAEDIEYQWVDKPEFITAKANYCFWEDGLAEFEHHVEFWLWKGTDARQVLMDIGRRAYILNDAGKTIDRIN